VIALSSDTNLNLTLVGSNTIITEQGAIIVPEGATLTIDGPGSLTATSSYSAVIGGPSGTLGADGNGVIANPCGDIIINGGTITASVTGGLAGAAIGSSYCGSGGSVTINGGFVTAYGNMYSNAIGAGRRSSGEFNLRIHGGVVTAVGGDVAMGCGEDSTDQCNVLIDGGEVRADGEIWGIGSDTEGTVSIEIDENAAHVLSTGGKGAFRTDDLTIDPSLLRRNAQEDEFCADTAYTSGSRYEVIKGKLLENSSWTSKGNGTHSSNCGIPIIAKHGFANGICSMCDAKDIGQAIVEPIPSQIYDGSEKEPKATVKWGGEVLEEGEDYTVMFDGNINAGTASIVLTGMNDYDGTLTETFIIEKATAMASHFALSPRTFLTSTENPNMRVLSIKAV